MRRLVSAFVLFSVLGAIPASAATIALVSGDGETWFGGAAIGGGSGTTVVIDAHPAWQPAGTAQWVSYANTGFSGDLLAPPSGTQTIFTVYELFTAAAGSRLNMKIWADDTARLLIDGIEFIPANFSQGTCAAGSIGCEPNEFGIVADYVFATGGAHSLGFEVFQVGTGTTPGSNPFGLLYEGTLEVEDAGRSVPEPALMTLFGLTLLVVARRMRRA